MMRYYGLTAAVVVVLGSGCASNRYCLAEQDYQQAENLQPIQPAPGLSLPESAAALRIPPPPAKVVPFGTRDAEGNGVCLDRPPPLPAASTPGASG